MKRKIYLITWDESKEWLDGELRHEFITFYKKEDAEKKIDELKKVKGIKNIKLQETECCSM